MNALRREVGAFSLAMLCMSVSATATELRPGRYAFDRYIWEHADQTPLPESHIERVVNAIVELRSRGCRGVWTSRGEPWASVDVLERMLDADVTPLDRDRAAILIRFGKPGE